MPNTVQLKRSSTANSVPSAGNLVAGELAINYTDGNLFYKNASNVVTVIASNKFSSVTGNVDAGNIRTTGLISATGNITGGNVIAGVGSGGSITGAVLISASGNIIGGALLTAGITSATGNIQGGNVLTGGVISATGNGVIAGRQLTVGAAYTTFAAAGRGIVAINGTTALLEFASGTANYGYLYHSGSAGNLSLWNTQNGYVSIATNNTERLNISSTGVVSATANVIGGNLLTGGLISATSTITSAANITGGNILTGGLISATGNITGGNLATGGTASAGGNITGGNLLATGTAATDTTGLTLSGTTTGYNRIAITNTSASLYAGITSSTNGGGPTGTTTNDGYVFTNNATGLALGVNGSMIGRFSSTGLAVTGTLSATGVVSGQNFSSGNAGFSVGPAADSYQTGIQIFGSGGGGSAYKVFTLANNTTVTTVSTTGLAVTGIISASGNITGGNVSVGTSSPSYRFQVYNNTDGFISRFTGGTASNVNIGVFGSTGSSFGSIGTESNHQFRIFTNGVDRAIIDTGGNLSVTGDVIGYASSDKKFKTNIRPIPNALSAVEHIGGKLFDWTDEYMESVGHADGYFRQKEDFGIVAQDVQKVFPLAVRTRPDGSLAVDYVKLSALAFASIAELSAKLKDLEGKINDLTSRT